MIFPFFSKPTKLHPISFKIGNFCCACPMIGDYIYTTGERKWATKNPIDVYSTPTTISINRFLRVSRGWGELGFAAGARLFRAMSRSSQNRGRSISLESRPAGMGRFSGLSVGRTTSYWCPDSSASLHVSPCPSWWYKFLFAGTAKYLRSSVQIGDQSNWLLIISLRPCVSAWEKNDYTSSLKLRRTGRWPLRWLRSRARNGLIFDPLQPTAGLNKPNNLIPHLTLGTD
jgi:hypothetical protein